MVTENERVGRRWRRPAPAIWNASGSCSTPRTPACATLSRFRRPPSRRRSGDCGRRGGRRADHRRRLRRLRSGSACAGTSSRRGAIAVRPGRARTWCSDPLQRRIQRPESLAGLAVGLDPLGHRLDPCPGPDRGGDRRSGSVEHAARRPRPAAPRRRPRPLPRRPAPAAAPAPTRRSASHSSLRAPPPETRPTVGRDAQLGDQIQAVAQAEGDALEHGADQRRSVVAQAQPDERATGVGVGMGRALAGQIGQEGQALDTRRATGRRRPAVGSNRRPGASASRAQPSEPAADSITPITCQVSGRAWQKACRRPSGSAT